MNNRIDILISQDRAFKSTLPMLGRQYHGYVLSPKKLSNLLNWIFQLSRFFVSTGFFFLTGFLSAEGGSFTQEE